MSNRADLISLTLFDMGVGGQKNVFDTRAKVGTETFNIDLWSIKKVVFSSLGHVVLP